jgi:signal transduction histidine kinase/CheY-like chemotaxis protein
MIHYRPGIRDKLIAIFIVIKVLPLVALAWFAWEAVSHLALTVEGQVVEMVSESRNVVEQIGKLSTENSIRALDVKARESIERLTTDTAKAVAAFLYDRDRDIAYAASLAPSEAAYRKFLSRHTRPVIDHHPWVMDDTGQTWIPSARATADGLEVTSQNRDNRTDFHYRFPQDDEIVQHRPLFLEMTFIDLTGHEKIKVSASKRMDSRLRDISRKENTYCRAETYFSDLKKLKPGDIYVSNVIGAYVKGHLVGPYTRARAEKRGIPFAPESSGYAGKENPVGKRFEGIIRWAAPVENNGTITGYVTLALDHVHVMEFTDHIVPTEARYSPISDAGSGNYAFMWDYLGRCISHPRDYFIVGYDPSTGEPAVPWLDEELYTRWQDSQLPIHRFLEKAPRFKMQSLEKKPAAPLTKAGLIGLDGRFLNFAPQCSGWHNLTREGGSGSFLIYWSGLWKLTTAAAIPYFTGRYGEHPRGFGYVTIGANVDEFHRAANRTAREIEAIEKTYQSSLKAKSERNKASMASTLKDTAGDLALYTSLMIVIVIFIAIWMAATLTGKITGMIQGIGRFQKGERGHRLERKSSDEMGQLAQAFNDMADSVAQSIEEIQAARETAEKANVLLQEEIEERENAEQALARHRDHLEERVRERTLTLEKEISERKTIEKVLQESERRLRKQNDSLVRLARNEAIYLGNVNDALRLIVKTAAQTMGVERCGVWMFDQGHKKIELLACYSLTSGSFSSGGELLAEDNPVYFEALDRDRVICAPDAYTDPRTKEFAVRYLPEHNIVSMLDVSILVHGKVVGVICVEQMGEKRQWKIDGIQFVSSISDLVALALNASERRQAETEKKQLEYRLHRAEKMEAIGTLAGGVAHDLNNILSGIVSYPELLLMKLPAGSDMKKPIGTILNAGKRAAAIVQDLLTLARRGVVVTETVNLNTIVSDHLDSPEHSKLLSFHPSVTIQTDLDPDLMNILGSPVHLSKTVMNLISNSAEAMPNGGSIVISTQNRYVDLPVRGYNEVAEGDYAVLTVADTGVGISSDDLSRIFEPFYTKKKMGRSGTGLGMAVVWGTVDDHKGYIDVESREGTGTRFTLYFPITRDPIEKERHDPLTIADLRGDGETILVVDDVEQQRVIASMILTELGYRATAVSSGEKAVDYLSSHSVDLIVLDMIMDPGMDGLDTYRKIIGSHPGQKAIVASGYSETQRVRKVLKLGVGQYLKKPYSLEQLGKAVKVELKK